MPSRPSRASLGSPRCRGDAPVHRLRSGRQDDHPGAGDGGLRWGRPEVEACGQRWSGIASEAARPTSPPAPRPARGTIRLGVVLNYIRPAMSERVFVPASRMVVAVGLEPTTSRM